MKANYPALRARSRSRPTGYDFPFDLRPALGVPAEERERQYEAFWARGGLPTLGAFGPTCSTTPRPTRRWPNSPGPRSARSSTIPPSPTCSLPDNVFGCKRLCVDSGYYETYNRDHVHLVDISESGIERFTADGLVAAGQAYEFDVVICATGFAAMTGAFEKIRITGRDGLTLKRKWEAGPRT